MGMNISQMLGNDPDVLRYQLMQQEMQRYNQYQDPRMNLASTLGGLLGGGVVNVAQGRNFFQSNNPILQKASDLQRIYNETAQSIDPTANPGDFYKTLQQNLSAAGYGQQAAMAGAEAYKYTKAEQDYRLKERQVEAAEANVLSPEKTTMVTDKGYPVSFNRQTGEYEVRGKVYDPDIHGGIRESSTNPLNAILKGQTPGGAPGATPKGKDGKTKELTEEEKRNIWKNQNAGDKGTTSTPVSAGPNEAEFENMLANADRYPPARKYIEDMLASGELTYNQRLRAQAKLGKK